jgi:hypothetical protein
MPTVRTKARYLRHSETDSILHLAFNREKWEPICPERDATHGSGVVVAAFAVQVVKDRMSYLKRIFSIMANDLNRESIFSQEKLKGLCLALSEINPLFDEFTSSNTRFEKRLIRQVIKIIPGGEKIRRTIIKMLTFCIRTKNDGNEKSKPASMNVRKDFVVSETSLIPVSIHYLVFI